MKAMTTICDKESLYHEKAHEIASFLLKNISGIEAVMIIEKDGKPIENRITKNFEKEYDLSWLNLLSNLVSIRYRIKDFDKQLQGLEMTINLFKEKIVIVTSLSFSHLLIIIVPKKTSLDKVIRIISDNKNGFMVDDNELR